ncbi:VanZ family protein [Magnetospirillum molischianum]|uniref:VanZ-like domain-containing protein n=1 Tax=Magnetospirillum molischianum DSM 120 TaxID=1150626 RepID=H8FSV2_MAGML|nr:VanZ family protein [Magnetospirillum molischianum]CCG41440.1 hypothetical protein PHAMO_270281 [Magnetospirillum molischianum DSM 120]
MIRTGLDGRIEHVLAYACITSLVALVYANRVGLKAIAITLTLYAGVLEIGQNFTSSRNAAFGDFLASSTGILIGIFLYIIVRIRVRRRRTRNCLSSQLID